MFSLLLSLKHITKKKDEPFLLYQSFCFYFKENANQKDFHSAGEDGGEESTCCM